MAEEPIKVLLVEDDPDDARLLMDDLSGVGKGQFQLARVTLFVDAIDRLLRERFDVILLDLFLPDSKGLETLGSVNARFPSVPIVVLTGLDDEETGIRAVEGGAQDYLIKGKMDGNLLTRAMRYAIQRKRSLEKLQESETRLRLLTVQVPAALWITDRDLRITSCQGAILTTLHLEPTRMVGMELTEFFEREEPVFLPIEMSRRALGGESVVFEGNWRGRQWDCHLEPLHDADGRIIGTIGVAVDITERKRLEEQLLQAQKMEAIGSLAGGVAHDFNNILTAITGYTELTLKRIKEDDPLRKNVQEIEKAARRATDLTRQLLAFSRKQMLQPRVIDLNGVISGMEKMLKRLLGEDIEQVSSSAANLGRVRADQGQIEQLIMNLFVNARDAMPEGGRLIVETANLELDDVQAQRHPDLKPGSYVTLTVTDTGCGMDAETQARIFEPFFTTKKRGKGTGLGLATVYGVVKQSGGEIEVFSEPGKGSRFTVYFPRVSGEIDVGTEKKASPIPLERGSETILLVEDEEAVRTLVRDILQERGYKVLEAVNGLEALQLAERYDATIDLLLTDVVMPKMSGRELAERLAPRRPGTRILFMSGYTDDAIVSHGIRTGVTPILQKPFTPQTLARKVREVLEDRLPKA